jgi:hypothetical protein
VVTEGLVLATGLFYSLIAVFFFSLMYHSASHEKCRLCRALAKAELPGSKKETAPLVDANGVFKIILR